MTAPNTDNFDVIVVGGGPAGIVAATQAARAGARTLLFEKSCILGRSMGQVVGAVASISAATK
ncbi:MAG: FAD-dependent oxidoreductase [Chthoniobacteraceae bacterium]